MRKRVIQNPEELIADIQEAISKNEETKYIHRLDLVLLAITGVPVKKIADMYSESEVTIHYWVRNAVTAV